MKFSSTDSLGFIQPRKQITTLRPAKQRERGKTQHSTAPSSSLRLKEFPLKNDRPLWIRVVHMHPHHPRCTLQFPFLS